MSKILGVLGGMGPQATVRFYDLIVQTSIRKYGVKKNADFPHVLIDNIPVPDLIKSKEDEEKTVAMVENEARRLKNAGCTHLAMPCNTMHLYADRFQTASGLPFISMVDAVVERLVSDKVTKVVLLGTMTTMKSSLYTDPLQKIGIEVIIPSDEDKEFLGTLIHAVIADDIRKEHIRSFAELTIRLSKDADGILLGCTELPFLAQHLKVAIPVYDSPAILAEKCCAQLL
jgi:aspartate racemase